MSTGAQIQLVNEICSLRETRFARQQDMLASLLYVLVP